MITQNWCGIAVEPNSPHAFALALEKMADNPELAKEMGLNARHFAELEFGRETRCDHRPCRWCIRIIEKAVGTSLWRVTRVGVGAVT